MQKITLEEQELLPKFRLRIQDIDLDWYNGHDLSLLRWIRARNMDLDKAEKMLRKHLEWRKANEMDSILSYEFPENICNELPFKVCGRDTEGCMVTVVPFGLWDICTKFCDSRKNILISYIDYLFELWYKAMKSMSTPNVTITQAVLVLDYSGFSLRQITSKQSIEVIIQILNRLEANHPEVLKFGFVINAPRIFELLFRICKPLLTARTLSKIYIHGSNSVVWRQDLLKSIPHSALPSQYGGSNLTCLNYQLQDGTNFKLDKHRTFGDNEMKTMILDARQKFNFQLVTPQPNWTLRWSFKTENDSDKNENFIAFQLFNQLGEKLLDCPQADSHLHIQNGTFQCPQSGIYTLCFDNSACRVSKKLKFAAVASDEHQIENIY